MGIYDRDYTRSERPSFALGTPRSAVGVLVLVNVAVYVANALTSDNALISLLGVRPESLTQPWLWWQFLTYGFAHDPSPAHVLFNMLTLWFLGHDVEEVYGRREFTWLYLTLVVFAAVVWAVVTRLQGAVTGPLIGASGAVVGVVILYALHFPRRIILLFFVLPVPAWALGVMAVMYDLWGAAGGGGPRVAYVAHLAGAALAFIYYRLGWRLSGWSQGISFPSFGRRPNLRIHDPDADESNLSAQVDQILEKIHRQGEASLSRKERRVLETASREYQRRRRQQT